MNPKVKGRGCLHGLLRHLKKPSAMGSLPSTRTPHGNKECAMADTFWVWGTIKGETVTNECMKNEGKETFFPHLYYKTSAIIARLNHCGVQQSCDNVHVFIDIE